MKNHDCAEQLNFDEIEATYHEEINPSAVELLVQCNRCGKKYEYWVPVSGFKPVEQL